VPGSTLLAGTLFVLFALLSTAGAYLIGAHFRGRRTGVAAALATIAFFAALAAGMWALFVAFAGVAAEA
jgi:hypothetical protein